MLKVSKILVASSTRTAASKQDLQNSTAFDSWFKGSKIVDSKGKPLVCYHGTTQEFNQLHIPEHGVAYFTPAKGYSYIERSPNVYPVYLAIKKPFMVDRSQLAESANDWPDWIEELKQSGYDGIVYAKASDLTKGPLGWGDDYPQILAFYPNQIKSAISNTGEFNPKDNRITAQRRVTC